MKAKRPKKSGVTMVYRYGLLPPVENADVVREQMRLGHRYRNALVEVERARRDAARKIDAGEAALSPLADAVTATEAQLQAALVLVKTTRTKSRSRSESAEARMAVTVARTAKKAAVQAWQAARNALREDPERIAKAKQVWADTAKRQREARASNGLHWGTGAVIDEAAKAAAKAPLYESGTVPNDPRFLRWSGEGVVGIQVHQKGADGRGLAVAEMVNGIPGDWLRIGPAAHVPVKDARTPGIARHRAQNQAARTEALRKGGGNTRERRELSMRIGTSEDGAPIVAHWPLLLHRPLPVGGVVKRAIVQRRLVGPREEWSVCLTIDCTATPRRQGAPVGSGTVAIDLGWLAVDGGLRVANWIDQAGNAGELVLSDGPAVRPPGRRQNRASGGGAVSAFARAETLRSTRDQNFDAAREALVEWLRGNGMPEWMRALTVRRDASLPTEAQALAYLSAWKAPARLASLAIRWREHRFVGDDDALAALEAWRYHDRHLWRWEADQHRSAVRRRQDRYRTFAVELATRYERVIFGDVRYDQLARRGKTESKPTIDAAASNRHVAAPGELRSIITQAFALRGGKAEKLPAAGLSVTCPSCRSSDPAQKDEKEHATVCLGCTYVRDLDTTMCLNLLRAAGHGGDVDEIIRRGKQVGAALRKRPAPKTDGTNGTKNTKEDDNGQAAE